MEVIMENFRNDLINKGFTRLSSFLGLAKTCENFREGCVARNLMNVFGGLSQQQLSGSWSLLFAQ